jgi:hypothetical protein
MRWNFFSGIILIFEGNKNTNNYKIKQKKKKKREITRTPSNIYLARMKNLKNKLLIENK